MVELFGLETSEKGACTVLAVRGEVDLGTAPQLRDALTQLVIDGHRHVVVDLSETEFLDSTGVGALVAGLKRLRSKDGDMRVVCTTARVRRVFEITGLDRVLPPFESVEEACTGA